MGFADKHYFLPLDGVRPRSYFSSKTFIAIPDIVGCQPLKDTTIDQRALRQRRFELNSANGAASRYVLQGGGIK
jgi:hypothetical protein